MDLQFNSLLELLDYFNEESTCIEFLEQMRWKGEPKCPHCKCKKVYRTNRGFKCSNKDCYKKFSVKVGTIFENSKIKLRLWFAAIYLCTAHKKGISSLQLHRDIGVSQKTAWFMLHRIREMIKQKNPQMLEGEVQCDETYVGGKNKNRHADKKIKQSQGRSTKDKTPVFGMVNKKRVVTRVVSDTKAVTLKPIINDMVKQGSIVVTDEWLGYKGVSSTHDHQVIKHKERQFVSNGFHTNSIEGFWSLLKRGIYGIYHNVSREHLMRYCDEFSYRYNTREIKDCERFVHSMNNVEGRLKYKQLTA